MGWIKELKDKRTAEDRHTAEQLEKVRIIRAKLPEFWHSVVGRLQADCVELKSEFPSIQEYRCEFAASGRGFKLKSGGIPGKMIRAEANFEGLCVTVIFGELDDVFGDWRDSGAKREITVGLNGGDHLTFTNGGASMSTLDEISRYFFSLVLEFPNG
jgi:hypothetical protein